jgi:cellulose synthase/poly-beta-1,6-N-acetylglucosamine synthase-like glycosyltransferase
MNVPALSVVVIGRNEGLRLARCLESVLALHGVEGGKEIIYVDSASTDNSAEIARIFGADVLVLSAENLTAARGRNAGWRRARAPFVLFLDGDTVLHPDFPRLAIDALASDECIAAVWGHRREMHPESSLYNRVLDLDWIYAPGYTEFCGGDVVIRGCALKEVDGFESTLIAGEEPELCRRLRHAGYRILHIDSPMTSHDLNISHFSQYWKRALRAGHAYAEISSRYRASSDPMWLRESNENFVRGGFWIASLIGCIALPALSHVSLLWGSLLLMLWSSLFLGISFRSGWKARWKAPSQLALLLLYGVHSHLQQIPILFGQLGCNWRRMTGKEHRLIEYKDSTGLK